MIRSLIMVLICLTTTSAFAEAPDSELALHQQDRQLHFATSFAISMTTYSLLTAKTSLSRPEKLALSFVFTLGVGVLKEATDKSFSMGDLKADGLGAGSALIIPLVFNF